MSPNEIQKAVQLSEKYCAACHLNPQPSELDANSWNLVLDSMGEFLGFRRENSTISLFENAKANNSVKPQMSQEDWHTLRRYFVSQSSKRPQPVPDNAPVCSTNFQPVAVNYAKPGAIITWVEIDPGCQCIHFADASTGELITADLKGQITNRLSVGYAITGAASIAGVKYFVAAKNLLPNDEPTGILFTVAKDRIKILQHDLIRPVHIIAQDRSLIVSEFGNLSGRLSIFADSGRSKRRILSNKPGYLAASIDVTGSIMALRAQADEAIVRFDSRRDSSTEDVLLRFSPSWGSTSMQLSRLGSKDQNYLVTSHGDNGDLPTMPFKPQHGIRVYENAKGAWQNIFFYPMPGAYKAMTADFNADGATDVAAIAYFTTAQPKESPTFRLLMKHNGTFDPCRVPDAESGQWITMDIRDVNRDGGPDIVLGAAYTDQFKLSAAKDRRENILLLIGRPLGASR